MRSLRLTSLAVAMVLAIVAIGGHPTPSAAVGGNQFVQLSNVKRASEGKPPVGLSAAVDQIIQLGSVSRWSGWSRRSASTLDACAPCRDRSACAAGDSRTSGGSSSAGKAAGRSSATT